MQPAVDLDDRRSWPAAIQDFARHWAAELHGSTRSASDLNIPPAAGDAFMQLIEGWPIRAYHCTRLRDDEAAAILQQGLTPLSGQLITSRIRDAAEDLAPADRAALLADNAVARGDMTRRLGQVCAMVGRTAFDTNPGDVDRLLRLWGGEAIYRYHDRGPLARQLQALGTPSIVVVSIRLTGGGRLPYVTPSLPQLFTGRLMELPGTFGEIHYYGPVGPQHIAGIWQPGDDAYDRHRRLPRR
jgi:hypothetical protein